MACLPADCLNEIFENLEEDKITLHSCLLVNRLWCEISVGILWRDIWSFISFLSFQKRPQARLAIFNTLIACLPYESSEFLCENGLDENEIFVSASTSEPPLFNYALILDCDIRILLTG